MDEKWGCRQGSRLWARQQITTWAVRPWVVWSAWFGACGLYRPEPCRDIPQCIGVQRLVPSRIPVSVSVRFTFEAANYGRSDRDSLLHLADKRICCDEKINACPLFSCWIIIALHILILGVESSVGHWCTRHTKITWLIFEWRLSSCHLLENFAACVRFGTIFQNIFNDSLCVTKIESCAEALDWSMPVYR